MATYGTFTALVDQVERLESRQDQDDAFRSDGPRWTVTDATNQSREDREYTDRKVFQALTSLQGSMSEMKQDMREIRRELKDK